MAGKSPGHESEHLQEWWRELFTERFGELQLTGIREDTFVSDVDSIQEILELNPGDGVGASRRGPSVACRNESSVRAIVKLGRRPCVEASAP